MFEQLSGTELLTYSPVQIVVNILLSLVFGMILATVYRATHRGLSYSQSYVLTLIFIAIITSAVIMVIGNNVARAFALVGALSIIRFRTVVKDTKDTAYIFLALTIGLACGTGTYFLAAAITTIFSVVSFTLSYLNYGLPAGGELIIRFFVDNDVDDKVITDAIDKKVSSYHLLHAESVSDGKRIHVTYDINLNETEKPKDLISTLSEIEGVAEIVVISGQSNVDF